MACVEGKVGRAAQSPVSGWLSNCGSVLHIFAAVMDCIFRKLSVREVDLSSTRSALPACCHGLWSSQDCTERETELLD
jgi:hypothetical protein